MTPERWARVSALFDEARQRPPAERQAWLAGTGDDDAVVAEVEAMLAAYDTDPEYLEQPVDTTAVDRAVDDSLVGRRLGAYKLVRAIGRGGMGVVYEARRDDQEFDRRAAIKILPVWSAGAFAERFRLERQVLAGLDHPGIARLVDAGTTADGVAWFVMEFVDGAPVTTWCHERRASIRERISLVERIADAVAYAHRHLVIHRDLKPANILVTAEGQPKLLDFGIAAIVAADGAAAGTTRTGHHSFTPEFASPEQVRGERVTTASDVYSLGVLLYVLVSEQPPYRLDGLSPLDQLRVICEVDPPPPSAVAPAERRSALRGDLDQVIAKALRKAPADRYATVAELAADLRAWHEGRPVLAAPAAVGYRVRRFVGRHKAAVAAALAVAVALGGGAVATAWQARIAQQERDKAQNRFRQVEVFSRSLLFDVHEALRNVPGATESRRLLLDRAVQFLDGLAADAGDDDGLALELASGYQRLANVQGVGFSENVGDVAAATTSLEKAVRLVDGVLARQPDALDPLLLAVGVQFTLATTYGTGGHDGLARTAETRHGALLERLAARHASAQAAQVTLADSYSEAGRMRTNRGDYEGAEQAYREAVRRFDALPAELRRRAVVQDHAFALKRLGAVLLRRMALDESEQCYRQALALDQEAIRLEPGSAAARFDITFTYSDLALVLSRRGDWPGAVAMWTEALAIRQAAATADPKNMRALIGVGTLLGRLGQAAWVSRDFATSVAHYEAELAVRQQVIDTSGSLPSRIAERAWARLNLAASLLDRADAEPRAVAAAGWRAAAATLVRACGRGDGKASVTAGSEPGYLEKYDGLMARIAARPIAAARP